MKNRRGLSDVVTTVLIILLAIAAVSIVWSFVSPTLKEAGEKISLDCIQLQVEPTTCSLTTTAIQGTCSSTDETACTVSTDCPTGETCVGASSTSTATVGYQWKGGEGLTGVRLVVSDGSESVVGNGNAPSTVLGTSSSTLDITSVTGADKKASVIAVTSSGVCSSEGVQEFPCS